jgi:hypothetical protein
MRYDEGYRWGDDLADRRELDAWITRGPENDGEDCLDLGAEEPCGTCVGCEWRREQEAQASDDDFEEPMVHGFVREP